MRTYDIVTIAPSLYGCDEGDWNLDMILYEICAIMHYIIEHAMSPRRAREKIYRVSLCVPLETPLLAAASRQLYFIYGGTERSKFGIQEFRNTYTVRTMIPSEVCE